MSVKPDQLCQIEIKVANLEQAIAFYRHVLGWNPVPAHIHDYVVLEVPEGCPFGISLVPQEAKFPRDGRGVVLYFRTANGEEIVSRAAAWGGRRLPDRRLPGYGTIAQFEDPDGQAFGLFW